MGTYIAGTNDVYAGDDVGTTTDSDIGYVNRIPSYGWINPTLKRNQENISKPQAVPPKTEETSANLTEEEPLTEPDENLDE